MLAVVWMQQGVRLVGVRGVCATYKGYGSLSKYTDTPICFKDHMRLQIYSLFLIMFNGAWQWHCYTDRWKIAFLLAYSWKKKCLGGLKPKISFSNQEENTCFYLISLSVLLALFSPSSCFVRSYNGWAIHQLSWSWSLHKKTNWRKKGDDGEWWGNERGGGREKSEVEIARGGSWDDSHHEELDLGFICHLG